MGTTETVDLSEFQRLSKQIGKRKRCQVEIALGQLGEKHERQQLLAALAEDKLDISSGAVAKWCERRGLAVNHNAVSSHRIGSCSCYDID